jgi:hypothetical protein
MSFRQYGGINYAARNNIVKNNYTNANNLSVMTKVGQPVSYINFESDISGNNAFFTYVDVLGNVDVSGNTTLGGTLDVSGNTILHSNLGVSGILDVSGNTILHSDLGVTGNTTLGGSLIFSNSTSQSSAYTGWTGSTGPFTNPTITFGPDGIISDITDGGSAGSQTLAQTLALGNIAGTTGIDMSNQSILNVATIGMNGDINFTKNSNVMTLGIGGVGNGLFTNINIGHFSMPATASSATGGNVAIGDGAMFSLTTGDSNIAIGLNALALNLTGGSNVAIGPTSLFHNTGSYNFGLGNRALEDLASGDRNIGIGTDAGNFTIGSNNTLIGDSADCGNSLTYATAIGSGALCSTSNTVELGKSDGNVNCPNTLTVTNNCSALSFTPLSDYRIKENVLNIYNNENFTIDNLRPVTYTNKISGNQDMGLIAHELQEHFPFLVTGKKDGPQNQSINYIGLIPILIKEIQELKQDIKILKMK